jgi:hypothetical protein
MRLEGCLVLLAGLEKDLMETGAKVQIREPGSLTDVVHELIEDKVWELGLHGEGIQMSEIDTESVGTVLLLSEQHRGREQAGTLLNDPLLQHFRNLLLDFIFQCRRIAVLSDVNRSGPRNQWNCMVTCPGWGQAHWFLKQPLELLQKFLNLCW